MPYSLPPYAIKDNIPKIKTGKRYDPEILKEVKEKLDYYEEKLKLYHNKEKIKTLLSSSEFTKIEEYI